MTADPSGMVSLSRLSQPGIEIAFKTPGRSFFPKIL
jgi:hypothetical protein